MAKNRKPKTVLYRRKREGKTNYPTRLKLLLSGKLRVTVRLTNNKVIGQVIKFTTTGDKVLVAVDSSSLKKFGWNYSGKNIPAAYLVGLLLGKKSVAAGHAEGILDTGSRTPVRGGKLFSFLKGLKDSGFAIPCDESIFPSEERIRGDHIGTYAKSAKESQFTKYLKNNLKPEDMSKSFDQVKEKILQ